MDLGWRRGDELRLVAGSKEQKIELTVTDEVSGKVLGHLVLSVESLRRAPTTGWYRLEPTRKAALAHSGAPLTPRPPLKLLE